jgi:hypothetical protein
MVEGCSALGGQARRPRCSAHGRLLLDLLDEPERATLIGQLYESERGRGRTYLSGRSHARHTLAGRMLEVPHRGQERPGRPDVATAMPIQPPMIAPAEAWRGELPSDQGVYGGR